MAERLSPDDARILALEKGNVRGHTCKLLVVDGTHDVDAVRDLVRARIDAVPRLRQRLVPSLLRLAPPAWVDDEAFRVDRHVRDGGHLAGEPELRASLARLITERLDRDRPLWRIDVFALGGARTALAWRLHHAMADGTVAMRMAHALLFDEAAPPPASRASPAPARTRRNPLRLGSALRRELRLGARPSPLDRPVGPRREVAFVDVSLDQVKAIGHGAPEHTTVNDVVLSAVAGGLRRWLGEAGAQEAAMRVKVPVSLHTPGEPDGANRDSFMVVDLPLAAPDPLERLLAVARETRERKTLHDAQALGDFFRDLSHLSRSLERFAEHWAMSPRIFTLNVSNVPGPSEPQRVLGSPLLQLHSLAEIAHRHALRVAVVSAAGRISFGLCSDPDAVDRLELIAAGIEDDLGELSAAL